MGSQVRATHYLQLYIRYLPLAKNTTAGDSISHTHVQTTFKRPFPVINCIRTSGSTRLGGRQDIGTFGIKLSVRQRPTLEFANKEELNKKLSCCCDSRSYCVNRLTARCVLYMSDSHRVGLESSSTGSSL